MKLPDPLKKALTLYAHGVRALVIGLGIVAGLGILIMMLVTCCDVVLRKTPWPLVGAYDIVRLTGAITIACALPYTTAVKGHVAIEYFFHKLRRRGRVVVDTVVRLLSMGLFSMLSWQSLRYGSRLREISQVTATLQIPTFWVLYIVAFSCGTVVLVILHNMLHPGQEMIKP